MKAYLEDIAKMTAEEYSDNHDQLADFIEGAERAKKIIQQFIDKAQDKINQKAQSYASDFGGGVSLRQLKGEDAKI